MLMNSSENVVEPRIYTFPGLHDALYTWACSSANELDLRRDSSSSYDMRRWNRDDDGSFRHRERTTEIWDRGAIERVMALDSWSNVLQIPQDDDRLNVQIDTLVGTVSSRSYFDASTLGRLMLPRPSEMADFEVSFARRYTELEDYLSTSELELCVVFPVPGLVCGQFPMSLEENLELDRMTDGELAAALNVQIIPLMFPGTLVLSNDEAQQFCLRYHYRLPKIVGEVDPPDSAQLIADIEEGLLKIQEDFGSVLALVTADPVVLSGSMRIGAGSPMSSSAIQFGSFPLTRAQRHRKLILDDETAADLSSMWTLVRNIRIPDSVSLAMRRLSFQVGRERIEDEIVDVLIAAEALYLTDGNQQELGFRLALRAAALSDPAKLGMSRRDVFDMMKSAYTVRSKIVHGSKPKPVNLKVKGLQLSVEDFVQELENMVKQALREALKRVADSALTWPPDWDDLTLPS